MLASLNTLIRVLHKQRFATRKYMQPSSTHKMFTHIHNYREIRHFHPQNNHTRHTPPINHPIRIFVSITPDDDLFYCKRKRLHIFQRLFLRYFFGVNVLCFCTWWMLLFMLCRHGEDELLHFLSVCSTANPWLWNRSKRCCLNWWKIDEDQIWVRMREHRIIGGYEYAICIVFEWFCGSLLFLWVVDYDVCGKLSFMVGHEEQRSA